MALDVSYKALVSLLRNLAPEALSAARFAVKHDALRMVQLYREGIEGNSLGLAPLQRNTVLQKARRGFKFPESPLRGLGMDAANTLSRNIRLYRLADGWAVMHTNVRHHGSKLTVARLADVHENGMTIMRGGAVIRIPARPAKSYAYQMAAREMRERDDGATMQGEASAYLAGRGDMGYFKRRADAEGGRVGAVD